MKSAVPFLGVAAPARAALLRDLRPLLSDRTAVGAAAAQLWDGARAREERYVATALARRLAPQPDRLAVYRHWIVTGAWWDHVDEIVRHEAPCDRVEVRGLHRRAVAAAG
jgi:3-methyladenine DNA glycosylase AlkD